MNRIKLFFQYRKMLRMVQNVPMYDGRGRGTDVYVCSDCGRKFYTEYKDKGCTPFIIRCRFCKEGTMMHTQTVDCAPVGAATLYYFINKTAYSGMIRYNARGEYNVPFGRYKNFNTELITAEHSQLLQQAQILNVDYSVVFNYACPDDFIFLDPPYDCIFSDYGNEEYRGGFNEDAHRLLAKRFRKLKCPALLVIGRTPLTEELYGDLMIDEYAKTYAVNIRNRFHSEASHILVANY